MTHAAVDLRAFVDGPIVAAPPTGSGRLDGLSFAVKDLIDVAGTITGGGNPDWRAAQSAAERSAPVVEMLRAAGARLFGKTHTDELAFSLEGENAHYGTPLNPRAPDRLPGGSSSGSAAAVAGGIVDFALGTDTGGSVRIPASFCGLYGMRPTHGRLSLDGVVPFAPSYDTIGFFASDADVLVRVAETLMPSPDATDAGRFLIVEDAFALADPRVAEVLMHALPAALQSATRINLFEGAEADWHEAYRVLQGIEIWQNLGGWITRARPRFGPSIAARFADAATITREDVALWLPVRAAIRARLTEMLGHDGILILPTSPSIAPLRLASESDIGTFYGAALPLTSIAGHAGLPQVSIPLGLVDGAPVGLSMISAAGTDAFLLRQMMQVFGELDVAHG